MIIKITSIYGEEFIRTKDGIYTDKGFIPIEYIDIIGEVKE